MVQSLFELSSHTVRNAAIEGQISDLGCLPFGLRIWTFELFRMKQVLNNRNVIRLVCHPEFLNGFTTISMQATEMVKNSRYRLDWDTYERSFLPSLVTTFGENRHLAEHITDLSLSILANCDVDEDQWRTCCPQVEAIGTLLSLCKHLKRLQLVAQDQRAAGNSCFPYLHDFSSTTGASTPRLVHLSLIDTGCYFKLKWMPKRWFESLQSLRLRDIHLDADTYSDVLTRSQNTLTSLDVVDQSFWISSSFSTVPVRLPMLRILSVEKCASMGTIFEDIVNHCPNLAEIRLKIRLVTLTQTELDALAKLSDRLQLHLTVETRRNFFEIVDVAGQCIFGLTINGSPFDNQDYDRILSDCKNLRCLGISAMSADTAVFLQQLLGDKDRAAKLIELDILHFSWAPALTPLFENCRSLQRLRLFACCRLTDFDECLQMWVQNGARPTSVSLRVAEIRHPANLKALIEASGRDLKGFDVITRNVDQELHQTCLNALGNCSPFVQVFDTSFRIACNLGLLESSNEGEKILFY